MICNQYDLILFGSNISNPSRRTWTIIKNLINLSLGRNLLLNMISHNTCKHFSEKNEEVIRRLLMKIRPIKIRLRR